MMNPVHRKAKIGGVSFKVLVDKKPSEFSPRYHKLFHSITDLAKKPRLKSQAIA